MENTLRMSKRYMTQLAPSRATLSNFSINMGFCPFSLEIERGHVEPARSAAVGRDVEELAYLGEEAVERLPAAVREIDRRVHLHHEPRRGRAAGGEHVDVNAVLARLRRGRLPDEVLASDAVEAAGSVRVTVDHA